MKHRFVVRTIRDGTVRVFGRTYKPSNSPSNGIPYDGRLDGSRWAFGRYSLRPDLLCMWGTEEAYRAVGTDEFRRLWESAPNVFEVPDPSVMSIHHGGSKRIVNWGWWTEVKP